MISNGGNLPKEFYEKKNPSGEEGKVTVTSKAKVKSVVEDALEQADMSKYKVKLTNLTDSDGDSFMRVALVRNTRGFDAKNPYAQFDIPTSASGLNFSEGEDLYFPPPSRFSPSLSTLDKAQLRLVLSDVIDTHRFKLKTPRRKKAEKSLNLLDLYKALRC